MHVWSSLKSIRCPEETNLSNYLSAFLFLSKKYHKMVLLSYCQGRHNVIETSYSRSENAIRTCNFFTAGNHLFRKQWNLGKPSSQLKQPSTRRRWRSIGCEFESRYRILYLKWQKLLIKHFSAHFVALHSHWKTRPQDVNIFRCGVLQKIGKLE